MVRHKPSATFTFTAAFVASRFHRSRAAVTDCSSRAFGSSLSPKSSRCSCPNATTFVRRRSRGASETFLSRNTFQGNRSTNKQYATTCVLYIKLERATATTTADAFIVPPGVVALARRARLVLLCLKHWYWKCATRIR